MNAIGFHLLDLKSSGMTQWFLTVYLYVEVISWKAGGIPRVSTILRLSVENERDDAGWHGRTRLARPTSQEGTGTTWKQIFLPVELTTSRIDNHAQFIFSLLKVLIIHTYSKETT